MVTYTEHEGKTRLHLRCETCGEPIQDTGLAVLALLPGGKTRIVHKNVNGRRCDKTNGGKQDAGSYELGHALNLLCGAYEAKGD